MQPQRPGLAAGVDSWLQQQVVVVGEGGVWAGTGKWELRSLETLNVNKTKGNSQEACGSEKAAKVFCKAGHWEPVTPATRLVLEAPKFPCSFLSPDSPFPGE